MLINLCDYISRKDKKKSPIITDVQVSETDTVVEAWHHGQQRYLIPAVVPAVIHYGERVVPVQDIVNSDAQLLRIAALECKAATEVKSDVIRHLVVVDSAVEIEGIIVVKDGKTRIFPGCNRLPMSGLVGKQSGQGEAEFPVVQHRAGEIGIEYVPAVELGGEADAFVDLLKRTVGL